MWFLSDQIMTISIFRSRHHLHKEKLQQIKTGLKIQELKFKTDLLRKNSKSISRKFYEYSENYQIYTLSKANKFFRQKRN